MSKPGVPQSDMERIFTAMHQDKYTSSQLGTRPAMQRLTSVQMVRFLLVLSHWFALTGALAVPWIGEIQRVDGIAYQCKCYSDNTCWPGSGDWEELNKTVDGTLQLAIPPGAVCHQALGNSSVNTYDPVKCADTQANWLNEQWLQVLLCGRKAFSNSNNK